MKRLEGPITTIVYSKENGERTEIKGSQVFDLSDIGELEEIPQPDQDYVARIQKGAGDIHER